MNRRERRQRRGGRANRRQVGPADSPKAQLQAFLTAPGKMYIIQLPGNKSTVAKVTDRDEPFFRMFCAQLQGVLGDEFKVIPATPVDAKFADSQMIAEDTAQQRLRIRQARKRQEEHEAELDAAIDRRPAGKRSGRHRADEPDTTFDRLARAGATDDAEAAAQLASIELAAAHDAVALKQEELDEANARLREAHDRGAEIHNRRVLDQQAQQASDTIAEHSEPWTGGHDGPSITAYDPDDTPIYPQYEISGPGRFECESVDAAEPVGPQQTVECDWSAECNWKRSDFDKGRLAIAYGQHIREHVATDENERCSCPRSMADDSRTGTHPRCEIHGPDRDKPRRIVKDNPQA